MSSTRLTLWPTPNFVGFIAVRFPESAPSGGPLLIEFRRAAKPRARAASAIPVAKRHAACYHPAKIGGFETVMRKGAITRKTRETSIEVGLDLDGSGVADVKTGVGFFDHMLDQLARHSLIDIKIRAE